MSTAAEPPPETTPKPWGFLSLQSWEPKSQHPLANGIDAKSTKLCGGDSQNGLIVGRGQGSAVRLHKALNWTSNKHLFIRRDADTGVITLTDNSSNGTWVNAVRVDKGNPKTIKSGDLIELAAEADGEHKQVVFVFTESAPVPQPPQAPRSGDSANEPPSSKRQRLSIGSVQLSTQSQTQPNGQTSEPTVTMPNASGDASLLRRREAECALLRSELSAVEASADDGQSMAVEAAMAEGAASASADAAAERERLIDRAKQLAEQNQMQQQEHEDELAAVRQEGRAAVAEAKAAAAEEVTRLKSEAEVSECRLRDLQSELSACRARCDAALAEARAERQAANSLRSILGQIGDLARSGDGGAAAASSAADAVKMDDDEDDKDETGTPADGVNVIAGSQAEAGTSALAGTETGGWN